MSRPFLFSSCFPRLISRFRVMPQFELKASEHALHPTGSGERADTLVLLGIVGAVALVHVLTNNRYGFHRDELQTLSDALHLDWGFVAYPPFTPFVEQVEEAFTSCRLAGHNGNPYGIKNEESEDHPDIFVCGGPRELWREFWKHHQRFG